MKSLDGSQKSQSVNCEKLEGEIEDSVNKYLLESLTKRGLWLFNIIMKPIQWYLSLSKKISERFFNFPSRKAPIVFDSKGKEECKYIQKYAEIRISYYTTILAIIIFVIAIGLSYFLTFYYSNIISSVGGAIMAIISSLALIVVIPKYGIYCRIVLDAEKRILIISEGGIEPNQSQATTNTQQQAQENLPSIGQNIATSDDKIKEIDDKIQESLRKLGEASSMQGSIGKPLLYHGELLAYTSEKSTLSIDKLYQSSKQLENLTKILIALTFFLAGLTIFDLYTKHPSSETYLYIIFAFFAGLIAAFGINELIAKLRKG